MADIPINIFWGINKKEKKSWFLRITQQQSPAVNNHLGAG
jgi:hypothetical protein